ncbi:hypothetical protein BC941DRAFT_476848 [Chlamydoabsidia padenii]|nr:hypothetical protein BC941DRAFT_476848 [Chlamydoabsidia padenii]
MADLTYRYLSFSCELTSLVVAFGEQEQQQQEQQEQVRRPRTRIRRTPSVESVCRWGCLCRILTGI